MCQMQSLPHIHPTKNQQLQPPFSNRRSIQCDAASNLAAANRAPATTNPVSMRPEPTLPQIAEIESVEQLKKNFLLERELKNEEEDGRKYWISLF
ncbi:hypothetical protein AB3S75_041617 [Citrus x aurantiifolia]